MEKSGVQSADKRQARILCVDDEPNVLEAIAVQLGRRYDVQTATSGAQALALLREAPDTAVVVSDMRMPVMDGAAFLAQARAIAPDTVRLLLTGQTDIGAAISAVNEGQIFRFLTKPCAPAVLQGAIAAAVEQHLLITGQRVLLEQTLHGAVKALTDVLAFTSPSAFGRATRIKRLVTELTAHLGVKSVWQVEVAAMLSQLGHATLPPETAEKAYFGRTLSFEEQKLVDNLPQQTELLLGNIPRLEGVREILAGYVKPVTTAELAACARDLESVQFATQLLRVSIDYDAVEAQGQAPAQAIETLRGRNKSYTPELLSALTVLRGQEEPGQRIRELAPHDLAVGMVLAEDITLPNGILLVARGYEVTSRFLERLRNLPRGSLNDKLRVIGTSTADHKR